MKQNYRHWQRVISARTARWHDTVCYDAVQITRGFAYFIFHFICYIFHLLIKYFSYVPDCLGYMRVHALLFSGGISYSAIARSTGGRGFVCCLALLAVPLL
jgi:hypothetical protein